MSPGDDQGRKPPKGPPPREPTPLPAITVDTAEANSLGFVGSGLGRTRSAPASALPSTPTPTLGGPAVRHSRGGPALVTFTPSLNSTNTGGVSPALPGVFPSDGARFAVEASRSDARSSTDTAERCVQDLQQLYEELLGMTDIYPAPLAHHWQVALDQVVSLEAMRVFLGSLSSPPRSLLSAESVWQYHVREMFHDLGTANPTAGTILVFLVTRMTSILRRAWDEVIAPYLDAISHSAGLRPRVSLEIPSPGLRLGGFARPEIAVPQRAISITSRPMSPSSLASDTSFRGASASATHFYTQANTGIASLDLPLSSDASGRVSTEATDGRPHHLSTRDPAMPIRQSLDSLESGVAEIDQELHILDEADATEALHVRVGYLKKLRKRMMAMLTLGRGSLSRSGSPSPTATPRGETVRDPRLGPVQPIPSPLAQDVVAPPQPISGPQSPPPWHVAPNTPAPQGAMAVISPSPDGIYYPRAIVQTGTSQNTGTPAPMPMSTTPGDPNRRPPVVGRIPTPSVVLPPYATSPDADIVHLLRLSGTDNEIIDPNHWISLFERAVGACLFSTVGPSDPHAPSTSTSAARFQLTIACTNHHHRELGLPCTLPITIPLSLDLSALLRQLEISQGTRVSQLMAIVAQAFIGHHQAAGSSDTLIPGPSNAATVTTTDAEASSSGSAPTANTAANGSSTGTTSGSGLQATSGVRSRKAVFDFKGKGRLEENPEEE